MHKPRGVVASRRDPWGRSTVYDLLPPGLPTVETVGRLDRDTTGLLLFSDDFPQVQRLLLPRFSIPRIYLVTTNRPLPPEAFAQLEAGLLLEGRTRCRSVRAEAIADCRYRFTLTEGKHREVRRLAMHFHRRVTDLHRLVFGPIHLGDLPPGGVRPLNEVEVAALKNPAE
ncbi:MAG: pseudouridine synthase [candidate division FCPU426 bacterium]